MTDSGPSGPLRIPYSLQHKFVNLSAYATKTRVSLVLAILEGYTQRRKTAQVLALRARIVLGCAAGLKWTLPAGPLVPGR